MGSFVLLPGAWLVGEVFEPVVQRLKARGHVAMAVTFPGLVEDSDEGHPDLETWIAATIEAVEAAGRGVVLVGHSFSGIVAGVVADRLDSHVRQLAYLDANLPIDQESFVESWSEAGQQWLEEQLAVRSDGRWSPNLDQEETKLDDQQQETLMRQAFPMPAGPLFQRAALSDEADQKVRTTYVLCTRDRAELPSTVVDRVERFGWDVRYLDAGHWPMVSHPAEVASILHEISV